MAKVAEQFELRPNQIIQLRQHVVADMAGLLDRNGVSKALGPSAADFADSLRKAA